MPVYRLGALVPALQPDVWIAPNATVIGDVVLGAGSSVWFGAVIRGDVCPIRIGARTNIQDNAVIHVTAGTAPTNVGSDVTIGHLALLHGCTVGDRCLVGMGSTVLDGAVLEDECFVAAGALVPPGMRVPTRSLVVGRPARRVRGLDEGDLGKIRSAAEHYVEYARHFAARLEPV
jgi:gamma-carbonic anhydrase